MNGEWYVLSRGIEYQIVLCTGGDPLYGYGSWDLFSGPFDSREEAENSVPEEA